jgi:lambda family phage portal protein
MGNGAINILQPGESIETANPSRPNANFDGFVNAMCRYIGAALEVPQELLQKSFQSSYSASRAALLEAWKMFKMRRAWTTQDFCQPIYEEWLAEAVARGRIKAPGFFNDPIKRKAWCGAEWNGPSPGQLDPVKEVTAATMRINNGLSTREKETQELTGGDFDRNIEQLAREKKLMESANIMPSQAMQTKTLPNEGEGGKNNDGQE